MKVGTCQAAEIGERMKAAREALGLTQAALAQAGGGSKPGVQDNEAGKSMPGGKVICGLVRLGINANWLLTGEVPMLLADLTPKPAKPPRINAEALSIFLEAARTVHPKATTARQAALAAEYYVLSFERGETTEDGFDISQKGAA